MPDLSMLGGGPVGEGVNAAASAGIAVSPTGTAHVKGSWAQLIASTPYAATYLMLALKSATATGGNNNKSFLIDIGVGAAASEQVLIPNIMFASTYGDDFNTGWWAFPVTIPAGTRLSARCQYSHTTVRSIEIAAYAMSSGITGDPGFGRVETLGANTATSGGTTFDAGAVANTKGSWVELSSAIGFNYRAIVLDFRSPAAMASGNSRFLVDVGVGGAGSEFAALPNLALEQDSGAFSAEIIKSLTLPISIAAGQRLAIRSQSNTTNASDRVVSVVAHGIG